MNRWIGVLAAVVLVTGAATVGYADKEAKEPAPVTVTGEIVDLGCYLGHGAKGADHQSCALKCIAGGMPMGLLAEDGSLYLLTMSHSDADPFEAAKEMAAEMVAITGPVLERDGMKALEVDSVEKVEKDHDK